MACPRSPVCCSCLRLPVRSNLTWNKREHKYVALKIYVHTSRVHRELPIYEVMSPILEKTKNPGRNNIRRLLGSFEIDGPDGRHVVLVM
jgi:hypothetical protein